MLGQAARYWAASLRLGGRLEGRGTGASCYVWYGWRAAQAESCGCFGLWPPGKGEEAKVAVP